MAIFYFQQIKTEIKKNSFDKQLNIFFLFCE